MNRNKRQSVLTTLERKTHLVGSAFVGVVDLELLCLLATYYSDDDFYPFDYIACAFPEMHSMV